MKLFEGKDKARGVSKVVTPFLELISIKRILEDFTDFKTQVGGFEHFEAVAIGDEFTNEVGCGADVKREIRVLVAVDDLSLRVVQR